MLKFTQEIAPASPNSRCDWIPASLINCLSGGAWLKRCRFIFTDNTLYSVYMKYSLVMQAGHIGHCDWLLGEFRRGTPTPPALLQRTGRHICQLSERAHLNLKCNLRSSGMYKLQCTSQHEQFSSALGTVRATPLRWGASQELGRRTCACPRSDDLLLLSVAS